MRIKRELFPKVSSILVFHAGLGEGRDYKIQINLSDEAQLVWIPKLKLDQDRFAYSFIIESSNKDKIIKWVKLLTKLLNVAKDKVAIDLEDRG